MMFPISVVGATACAMVCVAFLILGILSEDHQAGQVDHVSANEVVFGGDESAEEAIPRKLNWAEKMFSDLKCDFGVVARGAVIKQTITITNCYKDEMKLQPISISCGPFSAATLDRWVLKSKETATLTFTLDTVRCLKTRNQTVLVPVLFRDTSFTFASIQVTAYIHPDMFVKSIPPSSENMASPTQRTLRVKHVGPADRKVPQVRCDDPRVSTELKEVSRSNEVAEYDVHVNEPNDGAASPCRRIIIETSDQERSSVVIESLRQNSTGTHHPHRDSGTSDKSGG